MTTFLEVQPTTANQWRALVMFGRNVATYKFALGRALLQLRQQGSDLVALDDLAMPYAEAICEHLRLAPKQATSSSSRFLDGCRRYNAGELTDDELRNLTVRLGFTNVIDAFHRLGPADLETRFFIDERKTLKSIRLTDALFDLREERGAPDLALETEARWRLVETAWDLGVSRSLIGFDTETKELNVRRRDRRVNVTSCRSALNGYQKGCCFYCYDAISIQPGEGVAHVDHFFPWARRDELGRSLDGVWNLILACPTCNGAAGKHVFVPAPDLLKRLHKRNEFLISSHDPLRETLMAQTGMTTADRIGFLNECHELAVLSGIPVWPCPPARAEAAF
jgi:5-methylcytosine-specific restriction endonuclease McrA